MPDMRDGSVLLYDGLCGFCDGTVQFLLSHDRKRTLRFAPLQGTFAKGVLERYPELRAIDSIVLVQPARGDQQELVTVRTDVTVQLARYLGGAWNAVSLLRFVPRGLRDWGYDRFASVRYRIFGGRSECRIPTAEERARFLE